jgi:hypothetical protein
MRSPKRVYVERIRAGARSADSERFVDIGARVRVYRRGPDGNASPAELLPRVYGGRYDKLTKRYVGPPENVSEIAIHSGQVPLVEAIGTDLRHVVGIGPPGGGKTEGNVSVAVLLGLRRCNAIVGMVVPVADARKILWDKLTNRLAPLGWIDDVRVADGEMRLVNGTLYQFRATAKQTSTSKSPIAGLDWHYAVPDEEAYMDDDAIREIDARGRINKHYQIFSSATNEPIHTWQMRLARYKANPRSKIVRYAGPDNCFTSLEHWESLKDTWSDEEYRRYILCEDVPREGRVFPAFSYEENTRPLPPVSTDATMRVCYEQWRLRGIEYVIGWDPGVVASASIVLKAYGAGPEERQWFVIDEITTRDATTEHHARDIHAWLGKRGIRQDQVIIIGDPHENKETDRSDYLQMQAAGFLVKRANGGQRIEIKHRVSMTNALLKDANGRRRLFLAQSEVGPPKAQKLAQCFGQLMYTHLGLIDTHHKTYLNLAHWGDALGYGLFQFERFRGGVGVSVIKYTDKAS